jgi:methyl-accepting chemotaxis protein
MSTVNFALVKMAHQTWRLRLRAYLNGREDIGPEEVVSHRECTLGKWIYSSGTAQHGQMREFQELEKTHREMHVLVKQIVDMKRLGRMQEAEGEYVKVRESADQVVVLISKLEERLKEGQQVTTDERTMHAGQSAL